MVRWILLLVLVSANFSFADGSCFERKLGRFLKGLPKNEKAGATEIRERLHRIAQSPIVDKAIADERSVFSRLFRAVSQSNSGSKGIPLLLRDDQLRLRGSIRTDKDTLTIEIGYLGLADRSLGANAQGVSSAFYKLVGAILQGIDANLARAPGQFKTVKIVGNDVVNKRLSETLKKFGFQPNPSLAGVLTRSIKGPRGLKKGNVAKVIGMTVSKKKPDSSLGFLEISGTAKQAGNLTKKTIGFADPVDWVLEIPLAQPEQ